MAVSYPRQFGKYVLLKPLAKGGMGEIYVAALGQIDGFDKLCVIKKVIPEKSDEGKAKRFLDEAKVVLRLAHSGLVNTFDAGQVEREFYIAMEMVEGKDLREVWNRCVRVRHRIPIEVALHVAREVARTLYYVHTYGELNLVHRDVAPPNIMLAYNGDVKLTDFGLARSALKQEHTQPGVVFGRAAYLAPEQARGEVADPGTDVYSLAVVLWELLTGHQYLQIAGLDPAAALAMVRHPKPMPPSTRAPWVTPALDEVLMRALAPDRGKRFANAEEFRFALSEAIAEAAPRTDAARVSELMHAIYGKAMGEEAAERERFLKEVLPSFRAASTPAPVRTPPPVPLSRRGERRGEDGSARRSSAGMPKITAPPTPSGGQAVSDVKDPESRKRAKREAALHVLAELAAADAPQDSHK
jgi:serine/threonine protein kinase